MHNTAFFYTKKFPQIDFFKFHKIVKYQMNFSCRFQKTYFDDFSPRKCYVGNLVLCFQITNKVVFVFIVPKQCNFKKLIIRVYVFNAFTCVSRFKKKPGTCRQKCMICWQITHMNIVKSAGSFFYNHGLYTWTCISILIN